MENIIYLFKKFIGDISVGYHEYLEEIGFGLTGRLIISFLMYNVFLLLAIFIRYLISGDLYIFHGFFHDEPRSRPKVSEFGKKIIFWWNIFMTFVSVLLLVDGINNYLIMNMANGTELFSKEGVIQASCNHIYNYYDKERAEYLVNFVIGTKFIEWIDSILYILNGISLMKLHWWHHSTIVAVFSLARVTTTSVCFYIVNSGIHVMMYAYYALSSIKSLKVYTNLIKIPITLSQIIQFVISIWIGTLHLTGYQCDGPYCAANNGGVNMIAYHNFVMMIAFSYLFLFIEFFYKTYYLKQNMRNVETKVEINIKERSLKLDQ